MSVQAIAWVLEHSPTRGTQRLVLIALANHAGANPKDGAWESYPSIATIAREAGCDNERTVQYALRALEDNGLIERRRQGAPDERIRADRRPNLYRIHTTPPGGTRHPTHTHPVTFPTGGRGATTVTPPPDDGVQTPAPRDNQRGANPRTPSPVDNPDNGVHENDTPPAARGETRPRHGVNATAPKPSVNQLISRARSTHDPGPSPVDSPAHPRTAEETAQRLRQLLGRRTDRPTNTTGLRTGREALAQAHVTNGDGDG